MRRLTEVDRRAFLKGAAGTTVVTMGASTAVLAEDNKEYDFDRIDDRGNPIEENVTAESSGSSLGVAAESEGKNPTDPPDATIEASEFEWVELDPDEFENDTYALRLSDDGGVNFKF